MINMQRLCVIFSCSVITVGALCSLPLSWQNKNWYIYRGSGGPSLGITIRREMNCTTTTVNGMNIVAYGEPAVVVWDCYMIEGDIYALKGRSVIDANSEDSYLYVAFKTSESFSSPVLYPMSGSNSNAGYEYVVDITMANTNPQMSLIATLSAPPAGESYFLFQIGDSSETYLKTNQSDISTTTTATTTTKTVPPDEVSGCIIAGIVCGHVGICLIGGSVLIFISRLMGKNNKIQSHTPT